MQIPFHATATTSSYLKADPNTTNEELSRRSGVAILTSWLVGVRSMVVVTVMA